MNNDERTIQKAIQGLIPFSEAVNSIEASDGFPIDTQRGTFIFVYQSDDHWMLAGDHDDWTGHPMERCKDRIV